MYVWIYLLWLYEHTIKYGRIYPKILPYPFKRVAGNGEGWEEGRGERP